MKLSRTRAWRERALAGIGVGVVLFLTSYILDLILDRMGIAAADTLVNDFVIAVLGALAAYLWVRFEAERQARAREKLILAIELNHHIRNALTLITQCVSLEDEDTKYRLIDSAIQRIDRVLTELVPTAGETLSPRFFLDSPDEFGAPSAGGGSGSSKPA